MSMPFAEALLAKISQVPGILVLGGYYEPFLVILSVLCWYKLALALKLSPRAASASVILQLSFLLLQSEYIHPGAPFFNQLSVDKAIAAFVLAPVFLQSLLRVLKRSTRNNLFLLFLTGLSLTLMHPIILAYAVFIGGMLILFNRSSQGIGKKIIPMAILFLILVPQIVIRFTGIPTTGPTSLEPDVVLQRSGSENLVNRWGHTPFYGFKTSILTMKIPYEENIPLPAPLLQWGWIVVPICAAFFALKQWDKVSSQFILSSLLLCFLAWFPLTGWIMGYFLSARMLARSVWLLPFGISAVYLLATFRDKFLVKSDTRSARIFASAWPLITLTVFSMALFFLFFRENQLPDFEKFSLKSIRYQGLALAGQTLDQLIPDQAAALGSQGLNDLLPGLSWKSKLVTFRIQGPSNMSYFTSAERETRISDTQNIFLRSTSPEDKMFLLRKYNIHFLLLQRDDLKLFEDLIASDPSLTATEVGGVYIVRIY